MTISILLPDMRLGGGELGGAEHSLSSQAFSGAKAGKARQGVVPGQGGGGKDTVSIQRYEHMPFS